MDTIIEGFVSWVFVGLAVSLVLAWMARSSKEGVILYVVGVVGALIAAGVLAPLAGFGMQGVIGSDPIQPGFNIGTDVAAAIGAMVLIAYIRRIAR